ncbi:Fusaric acid resistance protein-like [Novymonas esmeraldas]|uniref:Fusaric acid resistance protein-like n=1 Tax=Novymonas esmeraldas TaxID=1808958 RepID=A0AAW0F8I3_9TRYP
MDQEAVESASAHPTQGSRLSSTTGTTRVGRRHVRARAHARTASCDSTGSRESPAAMTPSTRSVTEFPRDAAVSNNASCSVHTAAPVSRPASALAAPPSLRAYQEQAPRMQTPTPPLTPRTGTSVSPQAAAAAAAMLSNPERQRRRVATGNSNPLHVWGHEAAFLKSRYFTSKRRKSRGAHKGRRQSVSIGSADDGAPRRVGDAHDSWSHASARHNDDDLATSNSAAQRGAEDATTWKRGGDAGGGGGGGGGGGAHGLAAGVSGSATMPSLTTDTWSSAAHCRTRNMNALHAYSWDQRVFLPRREGRLSSAFHLVASPRFWEKLDWAMRGALLTILPTLILCSEPTTRHIFPLPTSVVFLAFWTTQPTLGAGLRETYVVLKGFTISFVFLCVVVAIQPGPKWLTLLIMFLAIMAASFVAEQMKRLVAYCLASLMMQYVAHPEATGYKFVGDYYVTLLIGQGFGLASFIFPYIRWSSENARRYLVITGDAISLSVHGACCSFWVGESLLERQLHVARLRQLRHTIEASIAKARQGVSEMGYEPHSGVYTARLKTRMAFLKNVYNIVQSMTLVIEQIAANPTLIETPMCRAFGERVRGELGVAAAAMDAMLLRIVDLDDLVCAADMEAFRAAKARYEDAVSTVRDEVILSNESYHTDNSDILLGFFLFSVEELMELISGFEDVAHCPSNLWYFLTFPMRDLQSSWSAFMELYSTVSLRHSITRRLKESIKLSLAIALAAYFQTYVMKNASSSPVAGVDIIAFVYRPTGGDSFQYAQGRLLGTVLGSLTGLLSVQLANGRRPVLYVCTLVLTFIGAYVQASPDYGALGSAMANSVISIVLQYRNPNSAMLRIQQNCFAILIYFVVTSLVWPVRGRTKVKTGFDVSLRMAREATDRLLRNLDLPHSATAVSTDVLALLGEMQKKVGQQLQHLPGAKAEPTLDSAEFPEMAWRMLASAQRKLVVTLLMMRHAYSTFMTSTIGEATEPSNSGDGNGGGGAVAAATSISVHWVVLHRISPYTRQLSQLFYEAMEVYLLLMSKVTFVPTSELTRLRLGMMQCYDRIVAVYIETLQHELRDDDHNDDDRGDLGDDGDSGSPTGATARPTAPQSSRVGGPSGGSGGGGGGGGGGAAGLPVGPASFAALHNLTGSFAATTPSGLVVPNQSFAAASLERRTGTGHRPRRTSEAADVLLSSTARSRSSAQSPTPQRGHGGSEHRSYKLTAEERQRLRDFVLGPNSMGHMSASFIATAAALAVQQESGGRTAGPANVDGNGSFANRSMFNLNSTFNLNNTFFNRNASMFDPALLRNAGIVVQEPVHEETVESRRGGGSSGGGGTASAKDKSERRPNDAASLPLRRHRGARCGTAGDDVLIHDRSSTDAEAPPRAPVSYRRGRLVLDGGGVELVPCRSGASADCDVDSSIALPSASGSVRGDAPPRASMSQPAAPPQHGGPSCDESPAAPYAGSFTSPPCGPSSPPLLAGSFAMRRSKTSKYAVPSQLQNSIVLPAGASWTDMPPAGFSFSAGPGSFALPPRHGAAAATSAEVSAGPAPSTLHTNASFFVSGASAAATATAGVVGGDVFGLGRAARPTLRPPSPWSAKGLAGGPAQRVEAAAAEVDVGTAVGHGAQGGPPQHRDVNAAERQSTTTTSRGSHEPFDNSDGDDAATAAPPKVPRADGRRVMFLSHTGLDSDDAAEVEEAGAQSSGSGVRCGSRPPLGGGALGNLSFPSTTASDAHRSVNASFASVGPAIPAALRSYVEGLAAHQRQQVPPPPAVQGNMSFIALSSRWPAANRSFAGSGVIGGSAPTQPLEYAMAGTPPGPDAPSSSAAAAAGSSLAPLAAAFAAAAAAAGRGEGSRRASLVSCSGGAPVGNLAGPRGDGPDGPDDDDAGGDGRTPPANGTFAGASGLRSGTFAGALHSFAGAAQSFNPALLRLLQPAEGGGPDGGDGGNGDGDVGGGEYVLTNSDIHSLEAFLFGLRALITQVEEVERYLLEVVHGTEMAKKL